MQSGSSKPRPSVASALQHLLRDVDRGRLVPTKPVPATAPSKSSSYFAPGDYAGEQDWWAKQLGRESQ